MAFDLIINDRIRCSKLVLLLWFIFILRVQRSLVQIAVFFIYINIIKNIQYI